MKAEDRLSVIYQTYFCVSCGAFEIPAEMQGKKPEDIVKPEVCPDCGNTNTMKKKTGRFKYRQFRDWLFRKRFTLVEFVPLKQKKPIKKAKKAGGN